jgi:hypothetical protein
VLPPRPDQLTHCAAPWLRRPLLSEREKLVLPEQLPDLRDAPDELLLTRPEMVVVMRTTTDRLERMEAKGEGPPVIRLGPRAPRYQLGTYRRWLQLEQLASGAPSRSQLASSQASPAAAAIGRPGSTAAGRSLHEGRR